jgi:hypothetical protein
MTTYQTGNPIGSADPRDLYDNAQVIDDYANSGDATTTDRLGVERATIAGIDAAARNAIANAGYEFVGDYAAGIELTAYNQVVRDTQGEFWRVSGSTALPYTTTGAGLPEGGAFVTVGDAALRQELASPGGGDLVTVTTSTGTQAVGEALDRRVIYVDTIADLQALDTSELVDGQQVHVKEYHAGTGVGGGEFYWDAASTETDNGGTIFGASALGRWIRKNSIYSDHTFGVPSSGVVTDDIQRLFDSTPERQTVVIHDSHELDTQVRINKTLKVSGTGKLFCNAFTPPTPTGQLANEALVLVHGNENPAPVAEYVGSLNRGSTSITVSDSSNISVGDLLYMVSDEIIPNGRVSSFRRWRAIVEKVDGNTVTFEQPAPYSLTSSQTLQIYKHDYLDGFVWEGVGVEQQVMSEPTTQGLLLQYCKNSLIYGANVKEGTRAAILLNGCFNTHVKRCNARLTTPAGDLQYGILIAHSSYCGVEDCYAFSTRTAIDISESDNCHALSCRGRGTLATHTGTGHLFTGCTFTGSRMLIRSERTRVDSCKYVTDIALNNVNDGCFLTSESARNGGLVVVNSFFHLADPNDTETYIMNIASTPIGDQSIQNIFSNNSLTSASDSTRGVNIGSSSTNQYGAPTIFTDNYVLQGLESILSRTAGCVIKGNRFRKTAAGTMLVIFDSGGQASRNVLISGNIFEFSGAGGRSVSISGSDAVNIEKVSIIGNIANGDTQAISVSGVPSGEVVIANNNMDA